MNEIVLNLWEETESGLAAMFYLAQDQKDAVTSIKTGGDMMMQGTCIFVQGHLPASMLLTEEQNAIIKKIIQQVGPQTYPVVMGIDTRYPSIFYLSNMQGSDETSIYQLDEKAGSITFVSGLTTTPKELKWIGLVGIWRIEDNPPRLPKAVLH